MFDQITALTFGKDLPVAQLAEMAGVSSREILQMNPKIKPGAGSFPAKDQGKTVVHTLAVPKGKGWVVVNKLKEGGLSRVLGQALIRTPRPRLGPSEVGAGFRTGPRLIRCRLAPSKSGHALDSLKKKS